MREIVRMCLSAFLASLVCDIKEDLDRFALRLDSHSYPLHRFTSFPDLLLSVRELAWAEFHPAVLVGYIGCVKFIWVERQEIASKHSVRPERTDQGREQHAA